MKFSSYATGSLIAAAATVLIVPAAVGGTPAVDAPSWSQWRGPQRNGKVQASTWPRSLSTKNLKELWRVEVAESYAGPVLSEKHVFSVETKDREQEAVRAFERATGKPAWTAAWPGAMSVPFFARRNGSWVRSTPAFDGTNLYVAGMRDVLVCLDGADGKEKWRVDFTDRYKTPLPSFGFVCSPLIHGDSVYVQAGASFVRLNKETGKTIWRTLKDDGGMYGSAFSSPVYRTVAGKPQFLVQTRQLLAGVDQETGDVLWQHPVKAFRGMNILTPTLFRDQIFTSSYGGGSYIFSVKRTGNTFAAKQEWADRRMEGYMSSPVVIGDHLYLHRRDRRFSCLNLATREERWKTKQRFGHYWSMVANDTTILALDQRGELFLIEADPEKFTLIDRRKITEAETWAHIAVAGDQLFVRELKALVAYQWR